MAIEKANYPKSLRQQTLERFVLAVIFVLANVTGRIDEALLENLFSWSGARQLAGFVLILGFGAGFFVGLTIAFEKLLKGFLNNIFLLAASVFLAIMGGGVLVQSLSALISDVFGLNLAGEFSGAPSWVLKSLVSSILFTLLFRHESRTSERLAFARNIASTLAKNQKQLIENEEKQRTETSRFLHDRVQAQLMVLSLQIANVENDVNPQAANELAKVRTKLENLRRIDLRRVGQMLTPNIEDFGLHHCLKQLLQHLDITDRVDLQIDESLNRQAFQLQLGIYRIVEQGLINSITHGPASEIKITATTTENSDYLVSVLDNGPGTLLSERSAGYGTAVIQSWVSILGATKTVESSPGNGYKLNVLVPGR